MEYHKIGIASYGILKKIDTLNSERLELKFLTYKLIMLLALTVSSWDH